MRNLTKSSHKPSSTILVDEIDLQYLVLEAMDNATYDELNLTLISSDVTYN